ncbi:DUF6002 family protein [Streptomyces canus]|uniref:DUF6002 family protein n=1 Tax=Streptomyces canus TaxID=58343 RepID=UPI0033DEB0BF
MILENALAHYYPQIQAALHALLDGQDSGDGSDFSPGSQLPELTPAVREYLCVSEVAFESMPAYRGRSLSLLDLTRNPSTMTTKTFASLVMVARAVRFIQQTGQRITIITPSSANKAVALRDAVLRAINCGLVDADQLNVIVVVPSGSVHKLRSSELFTTPDLRARNPIAAYDGANPEVVKAIARGTVDRYRGPLERELKTNLWYTLKLENYLAGDVVRAWAEAEHFAPDASKDRLHVHAVSSAYGLLGHAYGRQAAAPRGEAPPHYFLVQHLGAPDMVLSLYEGSDAGRVPSYSRDPETGRYTQRDNPRFPAVTFDPIEVLDTTFYSRRPATSSRMNALINTQGGGGIVVSLAECLERHAQVRDLLGDAGLLLPANPTSILEWSLSMAMTGLLNAIDRDLISEQDIVVHGSGSYSRNDFEGIPLRDLHKVGDENALRDLVIKATAL